MIPISPYSIVVFPALLVFGAGTVRGEEKTIFVSEKMRFEEAERLYQRKLYPQAADAYRRLIATVGGRRRQQTLQRLYDIANYWLRDTWEQLRQSADFRKPDWLDYLYSCEVLSEFLPDPRDILQRALFVRDLFHWDESKPFFNEEGRAIELLRLVHDHDRAGPFADKTLFLMGYLAWFREDYPRADECFSRLEKKHPASPLAPYALELAIKSKLMSVDETEEDKRRLAEARRLINKGLKQPELSQEKKNDLLRLLESVNAGEAERAFQAAEKCERAGKLKQARLRYQHICERFPGTEQASEAKKRLTRMKGTRASR